MRVTLISFCLVCLSGALLSAAYRSPFDMAASEDGNYLGVSDRTRGVAYLFPGRTEIALNGSPRGVTWRDDKLYVAEYDAGTVAEIDADSGTVSRRFSVGPKATGLAVAGNSLLVTEYGLGRVDYVDLNSGELRGSVPVAQQPFFLAVNPAQTIAAVAHLIPETPATSRKSASSVTLLDVKSAEVIKQIRLPYGSSNLRQIRFSPDGRWAYVVHTLGRTALPTTQLERGWINTNAMSIIDVEKRAHEATVLLDMVTKGAADPWGLALSPDGGTAWVTLAGAHEIAKIDLARLHQYLDGKGDLSTPDDFSGSAWEVWEEIRENPANKKRLSYHLSALYGADLMERELLELDGPRAVVNSGSEVIVAGYYAGKLLRLDAESLQPKGRILLGAQPAPDLVRQGDMIFHDARYSFQKWLSCVSCHPDGRADGMNWDLLNDGIGNPKNAKSLLLTHETPPAMALGVREDWTVAVEKGLVHFQLHHPTGYELPALKAYLSSLEPEASPYLVNGQLSPAAERGKELFHSREVGCAECHEPPLYTDLWSNDVGTGTRRDPTAEYDTPTLIEAWRTAPYLHDGRAATLDDVLTTYNRGDKHGNVSRLTETEQSDLIAYLLSL